MSDTKIQYRKTQRGEWVVMGPPDVVHAGQDVTVTRKNGTTKTEHVERVSQPFEVDGVEMVYGHVERGEPDAPGGVDEPMVSVPVSLVRQLATFIN
jgi:hypothetical protein